MPSIGEADLLILLVCAVSILFFVWLTRRRDRAIRDDRLGVPEGGAWANLPRQPPSTTIPRWAVPALVVGIGCTLGVAWISAKYFAGQAAGESPSLAMAYSFQQIPLLLIGVPLILLGATGIARPWTARRPWLRIVIFLGVAALVLLVLEGPSRLA